MRTPKSTLPPLRSTRRPTPTGTPPSPLTTSSTSRTLPPVVTISSTTRTRVPGFDGKAPLEGHLAIDSFRKEESRSKVLCHFIGQENAARHRTDNKFHIVVDEPAGNFLAELFRIFRALQDIEFFHIDGTMKSAREEKMAMHDSIGFFEHTQDTFVIHEGHLPFLSRSD